MDLKDTAVRPPEKRSVFLWYSLLFFAAAGLIFLPFALTGKGFVYKVDGASQYIVYLRYMGTWLRNWFRDILHGNFVPVMYDFSIGMGDDINAIIRFHPLDFLAVFVPERYTEYLYDVILLIRYYLSGLSFCAFALYWDRPRRSAPDVLPYRIRTVNVLSGSLIYVFGGYMLQRVMNHPTYASPFIVLPLLLLAAEYVFEGSGFLLFPLICALGFISNYYFMYICSIALFVYVLLRLPSFLRAQSGGKIRAFFCLAGRMASLYLLGLGLSLITLLPTILRYLDSYRTSQSSTRQNLLFYTDPRRYAAWLINLIAPFVSSGNGTNLNFAVTVFPVLILLFFACRKLRVMKRLLLAELICLLVPAGGYVMAGFNNENNRWMFLIALTLGMAVVFLADAFAQMSRRTGILLAVSCLVYVAAAGAAALSMGKKQFYIIAAAELTACTAFLLFLRYRKAAVRTMRVAVLACTFVSVTVNGAATYLPSQGNMVARCTGFGKAYQRYRRNAARVLGGIEDDSFWRADLAGMKNGRENAGIYFGYNGVSMYNSILHTGLIEAMLAEDNIGLDAITHMQDLDGRFVSEALAGVKYYVSRGEGIMPWGFSEDPRLGTKRIRVYVNDNALPMGVSCGAVISRSDYEALDPVRRELVKLHAMVVEDADLEQAGSFARVTDAPEKILTADAPLPEGEKNITRTDTGYRVKKRRASLSFSYEKKQGYVCMLRLEGLTADRKETKISVLSGQMQKDINLRSADQTYTLGREDYLIDLMAQSEGTAGDRSGEVTVRFRDKGTYDLASASFLYIPVTEAEDDLAALGEYAMTDTVQTRNGMTGTLRLPEDRWVMFQIPWQAGWTLYVDGETVPLRRTDISYMGAPVTAGDHEIRLVYMTPGLKAGALASAVCLVLWIFLAVLTLRRRSGKKRVRKENALM